MTPLTRDEVRAAVQEIITSIRSPEGGPTDSPDDTPLFDDGSGEPSPVGLGPLDTPNLALTIGERFDMLAGDEVDLQTLRTINDIADFDPSPSPQPPGRQANTVP